VAAVIVAGLCATSPSGSWAVDKAKPVDFNRDILPILSDYCFTSRTSSRDCSAWLEKRTPAIFDGWWWT